MSDITESTKKAEKTGERKPRFTTENCLNGMLAASVLQIVLALLLYLLASVKMELLLIETAVGVALTLSAYFKADERVPCILLRVINIFLLCGVLAFGIGIIVASYFMLASSGEPNLQIEYSQIIWIILPFIVLPPLLFLQTVFAITARYRRRFDLVLARINGILVLALSLILCFISLEYRQGGERLILTSFTTPKVFGYDFTIAIDNIITRAVFCVCSIAYVVFAFKLRSMPDKSKK
ncbi:MAG: hypothetical protein GX136_04545 [Clostridiales bacterium]|nr:hypothetical protein [Clostridiales bacterium]